MSILTKVLRAGEGKKLKALQTLVPDINALEPEIQALSDDDLRHKTVEFKERLANVAPEDVDEALNDLLLEAYAVLREAARRVIGQRHYDVQLMGGAALHFGWIAEMKTGEGKTLVSSLPVYLNGLSGRGVHVITVNDYLATRDSQWMGRIHQWMGLDVGLVVAGIEDPAIKRAQYACDVTYGTNNEFGFDYLRDNMAMSADQMVQRGHQFAIVDEVDSILVDEARTPLIISGQVQDAAALYYKFAGIVRTLTRDMDYEVDEEKRTVVPLEPGIEKVERSLGVQNLYDELSSNYVHQLLAALRAKELYKRDVDYVIQNGEVKIVDEFTGRILEGRRWSEGLHQAMEAKERVRIKSENQTLATITLQNYFRMYKKLAGMTGTAETEAAEFAHTYDLAVVPIPTHRPMVRKDQPDLVYKTEEAKFGAVVDDLFERYETGQPVLVGTVSVEKSERLSRLLDKRGVTHSVLNAKHHEREANIVAQAGRLHTVTVATNMAGRGVDIILGGYPQGLAEIDVMAEGLLLDSEEGKARYEELFAKYAEECAAEGDKVRTLGGLYVLGTERHESRRIDNQLRGRAGRQGDPGESRFYLSLEDELMRLFATGAMSWVMGKALPDDVPIEAKMVTRAIEKAQGTVESRNAEIRKDVLKYDEVMNEQRKVVYRRRQSILEGADLHEEAMQHLKTVIGREVNIFCPNDFAEDWNLENLVHDVSAYYPTAFTVEELGQASSAEQIRESLVNEAVQYYEQREESLGAEVMREIERRVMLSIIDQRWREHLYEMDYLQEGINLRAMGQRDPLTEWQREGYDMFGQMIDAISDDFIRYVMHLDVVVENEAPPELRNVQYSAPEDPSGDATGMQVAAARQAADEGAEAPAAAVEEATQAPVVKGEHEKLGRNQPCWCGSGKKFKLCHGK
ncbi:MAG TPA: preprotein translocase subunit SecA [Acidimicrobiales bacterium]|jgi:preprotein translocase subunit SecA|nr:preprotein translocase subunit SecA [Acidimicrobiales bacterium]